MSVVPPGCQLAPDLSGLAAWPLDQLRGPTDTWPPGTIDVLVRGCLLPQREVACFDQRALDFLAWRVVTGRLDADLRPDYPRPLE